MSYKQKPYGIFSLPAIVGALGFFVDIYDLLATIGNGFITSVDQYSWLRFIAGLGLAGELGASIKLRFLRLRRSE